MARVRLLVVSMLVAGAGLAATSAGRDASVPHAAALPQTAAVRITEPGPLRGVPLRRRTPMPRAQARGRRAPADCSARAAVLEPARDCSWRGGVARPGEFAGRSRDAADAPAQRWRARDCWTLRAR